MGDDGAQLWHDLGRSSTHAALQLAIRSVILRGLTFVGTIVLARLLSPSDFGVYGIVSFVVSICVTIGDFGLGAALVQQADEPTPEQMRTVWTVQQCITVVAVIAIWVVAPAARTLISGLPSDAEWMFRVLSLGLIAASLQSLPEDMMERHLRFGPLATADVLQMITFYAVAVALAFWGVGAWAFVVAGLAQLTIGSIAVNLAWRHWPHVGIERRSLARLLGFGLGFQISDLLITLRDAPLSTLAAVACGAASAGLIQFAVRIALTIASIDEIVAQIAFPAFARLQGNRDQQTRALESAILLTALLVIPIQCWIVAMAPVLIPLVFGGQWTPAIFLVQIICLGTLIRFPTRYLRQAVFARGESRRGLSISFAATACALLAYTSGLVLLGLPGSAVGFLAGAAAGLFAAIWLARDMIRLTWKRFLLMLAAGLLATLAGTAALNGTSAWLPLHWSSQASATAIVATIVATIAYGAVCSLILFSTSRPTIAMAWRLAMRAANRR